MSVEDTDRVDFITQKEHGIVKLIITDHLSWGDAEHLYLLQEKINTYLTFIETGQIAEHTAAATRVEIEVVMLHEPDADGREFLMHAGEVCGRAGYPFSFKVQEDA